MFKGITDLLATIFFIALAAFLVKNSQGTARITKASGGLVTDIVRAITFQGK